MQKIIMLVCLLIVNSVAMADDEPAGQSWVVCKINKALAHIKAGPTGPTGPQGHAGVTGTQGPVGAKGDTGNTGPTGLQGLKGNTGIQGNMGPQGSTGVAGPKGDQGIQGPTRNIGVTGPKGDQGLVGATGIQGIQGSTGATGTAGTVLGYADFYALMPGDNNTTIASNAPVQFPHYDNDAAPTGGIIAQSNNSTFTLVNAGKYLVTFQVSVDEAGQLGLALNGTLKNSTVVGRATGTSQIVGTSIIYAGSNTNLTVINAGSPAALTITPKAGGANPVSAHLVIAQLA